MKETLKLAWEYFYEFLLFVRKMLYISLWLGGIIGSLLLIKINIPLAIFAFFVMIFITCIILAYMDRQCEKEAEQNQIPDLPELILVRPEPMKPESRRIKDEI